MKTADSESVTDSKRNTAFFEAILRAGRKWGHGDPGCSWLNRRLTRRSSERQTTPRLHQSQAFPVTRLKRCCWNDAVCGGLSHPALLDHAGVKYPSWPVHSPKRNSPIKISKHVCLIASSTYSPFYFIRDWRELRGNLLDPNYHTIKFGWLFKLIIWFTRVFV